MLVNRNRVDTQGFELAGRVGLSEQWKLDASLTQAKSRVASTGNELRNRPEWRGGVGAHWTPFAALELLGRGNLRRLVARFVDRDRRCAPAVVHAHRRERGVAGDAEVPGVLVVDNLTDEKYEQFVGNEVRGILPRAGVRFSL